MLASTIILLGCLGAGELQDAESAVVVSRRILDDTLPADKRQQLAAEQADRAAEVVAAMVADMPYGVLEEYRRIPWIWRVSIAAGKRDQEAPLRALLDVAMAKEGGFLRDWQAVVIGGGIINGISLTGKWPKPRIEELLGKDDALRRRWRQSLVAAAGMADCQHVDPGTRYDALRMIALDPTEERMAQLAKYLAKSANEELQMGAVSGLSDVENEQATKLLAGALPDLVKANQTLAIDALLRTESRTDALLGLLRAGKLKAAALSEPQRTKLRELPNVSQRDRAIRLLDKDR